MLRWKCADSEFISFGIDTLIANILVRPRKFRMHLIAFVGRLRMDLLKELTAFSYYTRVDPSIFLFVF